MILKMPLDKIVGYIVQQIRGIQGGGPSVYFKKLKALFFIVLSLPIILLIRLLRPLIIIRFGLLVGQRIGHFAASLCNISRLLLLAYSRSSILCKKEQVPKIVMDLYSFSEAWA